MTAYLFAWNPGKWNWENIEDSIAHVENCGSFQDTWSCASHRSVEVGDRAFLMRLGVEPKGIIGSGWIKSASFVGPHWDGSNRPEHRVMVEFDVLLNPNTDLILGVDILQHGDLAQQNWYPQASGISIRDEVLEPLEAIWFSFTMNDRPGRILSSWTTPVFDGNQNQLLDRRYERNPFARKVCCEHFGYECQICGLNFEKKFGLFGRDLLQLHRHYPKVERNKEEPLDPVKDLIPVCPNCHTMLHRQNPPLDIDALKDIYRKDHLK